MFVTPQTEDGWITAVRMGSSAAEVDVVFEPTPEFAARIRGREAEVVFAARSRLARLGVDIVPTGALAWDGDRIGATMRVETTVSAYGVEAHLERFLMPGLAVGRLVFCPEERLLSSAGIYEALQKNEFQLPSGYSIDGDGRFRIRPRSHVYDLREPISFEDLLTIGFRADGRALLNRLQVRREVDAIRLPAGDGVITSCSMFLHHHYVVLDPGDGTLGTHLQAVVLDPVSTRGTNVYLEFANRTDHPIINPAVGARVFAADPLVSKTRRWYGTGVAFPGHDGDGPAPLEVEHAALAKAFDALESQDAGSRYSHRMVAVVDEPLALLNGGEPLLHWRKPEGAGGPRLDTDVSARRPDGVELAGVGERGTQALRELPKNGRATLLLGTFPNLVEHVEICNAAVEGRIGRLIFRRASFEHGSFLSARDHARLADYAGLGVDVFWCNDQRQHVVRHVLRGLRGYFVMPSEVERFRTSLVAAVYGSARQLPPDQVDRMLALLQRLHAFFGGSLAIMTGGGPGAMQQATDVALDMGMLVGASFIETVDQTTNQTARFYQTFQGRSRQARQRWFEIASFHLFFMGGVGTLEEVGLTLTDMKLGVIDLSPLVFFGRHGDDPYWDDLRRQFEVMVSEGRAPEWLLTHSLMTDDPDEVIDFYRKTLSLA